MEYSLLKEKIEISMKSMISKERQAHSHSVAKVAVDLCARFGEEDWKGEIAGLAHDLCKELPLDQQYELASLAPFDGGVFKDCKAFMVHAPAAAGFLFKEYGVTDFAILEAIACHTLGYPGMGNLATIVYCADKLEPQREWLQSDTRTILMSSSLEYMHYMVLKAVIDWHTSVGKKIDNVSVLILKSLEGRIKQP